MVYCDGTCVLGVLDLDNPLLRHHITQSHVQASHQGHAPQTSRKGAAEATVGEVPDATARGGSVAVVWCTAMADTCVLGVQGVLESRRGGLGC